MAIYHRIDFEVLARAPFAMYGMRMLETLGALPNPVVVRSKATQEGGLSVYAVTQVGEIAHIRVERQRYFWLALLTYLGFGAALASSAAYYMRERRHMKETVALNISLLRLNQDLEHEVRHDPLTGIYNRGYFVKLLAAAIAAAQDEPDSGFCVAVIDLDFFKLINDNHGHAAGDQALLGFVAIGRAALRSSDSFARIGGEEFAVLLPHTDAADAGHVIERLRQQLEATPIAFKQHSLQLTCSAGLTVYQAHDLVDRILRRADKALYYAKAHGRNQVVDYSDMNERTAAVPAPVAPLA
jgi:diguanylate cyclase (GGDEF)-like protein